MWALIYLTLILIGGFGIIMIFIWLRDYTIIQIRAEDKKEDFINYFIKKGISEALVHSVYKYLQNWMSFYEFPVRPQDKIAVIYGICEEDLDDLIIEIAKINNYDVPKDTNYWGRPIITVEDLIRFIDSFPKKKS
jgi:hypothetical protein